jgi:hypothetical protein
VRSRGILRSAPVRLAPRKTTAEDTLSTPRPSIGVFHPGTLLRSLVAPPLPPDAVAVRPAEEGEDATLPIAREFIYLPPRWSEREVVPIAPPRGRERRGHLYVLIEVEGNEAEETAVRLRSLLANAFYRDPAGSITAGLVRAVQRVNEALFAENEHALLSHQRYATLCCLVLRGEDAYFALAGRALTYIIRPDGGESFGRGLASPGTRPLDLLGQVDEVEVELHYRALDTPAAVILTSAGLTDLIGHPASEALRGDPAQVLYGLRQAGREHRGRQPFHTLVIVPPGTRLSDASIPDDTMIDARADSEDADPLDRTARPGISAVLAPPAPRQNPRAMPQRDRGPNADGVPRLAAAPGGRSRRAAIADGYAEPRVVPRDPNPAPPRRSLFLERGASLPRIAALASMLLILFFVGYLGVMVVAHVIQGGSLDTTALSSLEEAQQREREALGQGDPLVRRHLLSEADQLAATALEMRPDDPMIVTVAGRIRREYRAATATTDLGTPLILVTLPSPGDEILLNGLDLYVLDRTSSRIYKYLLNADGTMVQAAPNPLLVGRGDHIGDATVGQITHLAWLPAGDGRPSPSLLALDSDGFLITYDPTRGLGTLRLRDPGSWQDVTALAVSGTDLFVLNASQQSLARYPLQADGFDGPVYNYFAGQAAPKLDDAVDLRVGDALYLLHASGKIQKFMDGRPVPFAGPPGDLAPGRPADLVVSGGAAFVGDPSHARVIQLSTNGDYQRTLTDPAHTDILAAMKDIAVPEGGHALYVLSGSKVYRYPLPEERQ